MAKLAVLLFALLVSLLFAEVSSMKNGDSEEDKCETQVEAANLAPCEEHIRQRVEPNYGGKHPQIIIQRWGDFFPWGKRHREDEQQRIMCCNELRQFELNPKCLCEALEQIMDNENDRSQQSQDRRRKQKFEREIRNLPKTCRITSTRYCDLD
ncbi:hypothetical protein PIB30_081262 [Stylosanthes scabra]|uniref:Bifunctional inhibitor/plant lipid transfer protein/seed storage helical domain-containing protein n=1 Tax=Stylosanthes scabra TaxID=79078 RepID=A0ABU6VQ37_9FABA|nr:hypothetical protein [Stylosanthes scabra]